MLGAIDRMLAAIQATAAANHARGVAWQFQITRGAVVIVWHAFPAVWALAASDAISPEVEHVGYIFADLLAKFLLMFVYVASVNNHSTHRQIHHATGASPLAAAVPGVAPAVGVPLPGNGVALRCAAAGRPRSGRAYVPAAPRMPHGIRCAPVFSVLPCSRHRRRPLGRRPKCVYSEVVLYDEVIASLCY